MDHLPRAGPGLEAWQVRVWIALGALAFAPALLGLVRVWISVPYYAHGFLVPVFAGAAAYGLRERLVAAERPGPVAWVWLAVFTVYALGLAAGSTTLQGLAVVGALAAGVLQLWGASGIRTLAFPLCFLLFMVPPPSSLVDPVIRGLQLQVSRSAVGLLGALGSGVSREGNVLMLPGGEALFVADACSGITSLITLTPLAVALAWYAENRWPPRLWILASVVPLAMAANLLRVVGTTLAVQEWGSERVLASAWHEFAGVLTFSLACFGLLGVSHLVAAAWGRHAGAA